MVLNSFAEHVDRRDPNLRNKISSFTIGYIVNLQATLKHNH